jgi:hypothetical protein
VQCNRGEHGEVVDQEDLVGVGVEQEQGRGVLEASRERLGDLLMPVDEDGVEIVEGVGVEGTTLSTSGRNSTGKGIQTIGGVCSHSISFAWATREHAAFFALHGTDDIPLVTSQIVLCELSLRASKIQLAIGANGGR